MTSATARTLLLATVLAAGTALSAAAGPPPATKAATKTPAKTPRKAPAATAKPEPPDPKKDAWVELTPLDVPRPARAADLSGWKALASGDFPPGRWMVCAGGPQAGVVCEREILGDRKPTCPELAPGVPVTGHILVGSLPSAKAEIRVVPAELAARRRFSIPLRRSEESRKLLRSVSTDEAGGFHLPALAAGSYALEVVPPGGRLYRSDAFRVPRPEELRPRGTAQRDEPVSLASLDLGELRFDAGAELEVFVTDSRGAPVAHAKVGGHQGEPGGELVLFETEADADGRSVLRGIDLAKPFHLVCLAPGYARTRQDFEVAPSVAGCTVEALCGIRGKVVDGSGDAVAGASVASEKGDLATRTDEAGVFELSGVRAGTYHLEMSAPGYRTATADVELAPGDDEELPETALLPGEELVGRVLEEADREPIAGAEVTVLTPRGGGSAVSDADGELRLTTDLDGPVVLRVSASGYPPRRFRFSPGELDGDDPVELALGPGGRIHVVAWDEASDGPCAGCTVEVQSPEGGGELRTDGNGEALSDLLAPGRYPVLLVHEVAGGGGVQIRGGGNMRLARVEAGKTSTVVFGEPSRALTVSLRPPPPAGWRLDARSGGRSESVGRDPKDGDFHLRRHPGEPLILRLGGPGTTSVTLPTLPADFSGEHLDLELPVTGVRGRLVRGEEAARGAEVEVVSMASGSRQGFTITDGDGRFSVPFLPRDTYGLVVDGRVVRSFLVSDGAGEDLGTVPIPDGGEGGGGR